MSDLIERLDCGHPRELAVLSAETGKFLYCELCDCRQRRNDAEVMEQELRAALLAKDEEIARLREERREAQQAERENAQLYAEAEQRIRELEAAMREARAHVARIIYRKGYDIDAKAARDRIDALLRGER